MVINSYYVPVPLSAGLIRPSVVDVNHNICDIYIELGGAWMLYETTFMTQFILRL